MSSEEVTRQQGGSPPPPVGHVTYATVNNVDNNNASRKQPSPASTSYSYEEQQQQYKTAEQSKVAAKGPSRRKQPPSAKATLEAGDGVMVESNVTPDVAGVYAPLLRAQKQRHVENAAVVPLPAHVIGGVRDQMERIKDCQCQKSNCLKLYCECFSTGIYCNAYCKCNSCWNDGASQHQYNRNKAILTCLENNPNSFRPGSREKVMDKGEDKVSGYNTPCNCTKSRCLKKYCSCFGRGLYCKQYCGCSQCSNVRGNPEREKLADIAQRYASHEASSAAKNTTEATTGKKAAASGPATAAAPGAASAAGDNFIADDGNLPPSYYAIPMKLPGGVDSASLSFGLASDATSKKRKADGSNGDGTNAIARAMATEEAVLARRNPSDDPARTHDPSAAPSARPATRASIQTELEHKWAAETQDVLGTFQAMRQELLERKKEAGLLGGDIEISREYSYYDLAGSAQLAAVELDLADVMTSLKDAEVRAKRLVQGERSQQGATTESSNDPDPEVQALLCDEAMDDVGSPKATEKESTTEPATMNAEQRERATIQLSQDAALMRELARVIRRQALEMKEARTSSS